MRAAHQVRLRDGNEAARVGAHVVQVEHAREDHPTRRVALLVELALPPGRPEADTVWLGVVDVVPRCTGRPPLGVDAVRPKDVDRVERGDLRLAVGGATEVPRHGIVHALDAGSLAEHPRILGVLPPAQVAAVGAPGERAHTHVRLPALWAVARPAQVRSRLGPEALLGSPDLGGRECLDNDVSVRLEVVQIAGLIGRVKNWRFEGDRRSPSFRLSGLLPLYADAVSAHVADAESAHIL
mmetsp:Transcript_23930/g.48655  ORF Transcript_23930/g.48655 Transcript_23930/m.48655 type:complete len:239 (+) Transcript_23930:293-1009(+)